MTVGVGAKEDDFFRVKPFDDDLEIRAELIGDPVHGIAGIQEHVLADLVGGNRGRAHGDRLLIAGGSARGREGAVGLVLPRIARGTRMGGGRGMGSNGMAFTPREIGWPQRVRWRREMG